MNKNVVAAMIHNEYKDNFLNNKCLRHWKNRIQSKNHGIGNYEINSFFSYFDDKINVLSNGYHGLTLGYQR